MGKGVKEAFGKAGGGFSNQSPMEKAYRCVLDHAKERGEVLNDKDDPENEAFVDPLNRDDCIDVCELCRDQESDDADLMQCYTEYPNLPSCGAWFHPICVGLDDAPIGDWICQYCVASNLDAFPGIPAGGVSISGLEVAMNEDEEDEDEDDADDNQDNENTADKDDDFLPTSVDSDDDILSGDDESLPIKNKSSKRKPVSDPLVESDGENGKAKWVLRFAGERPKTARQQQDRGVRNKIKTIKKQMETLQHQSLPITRSDEFDQRDPNHARLALNQSHWPWVVHGAFCLTNQAPNGDGSAPAEFLATPQLHLWAGSQQAANWAGEQFKSSKAEPGIDVKIHSSYQAYLDGFRSVSGKKKKAPAPKKRKTSFHQK